MRILKTIFVNAWDTRSRYISELLDQIRAYADRRRALQLTDR